MTDFLDIFDREFQQLAGKGLKRKLRSSSGPQGRTLLVDGKKVLNFCSNNYLGLADHPRLITSAIDSLRAEGFGSAASRLVCGNMESHRRLEKAMAQLKKTEGCLLFSSGYMANVGIISGLFGRDDFVLSDKLNHASIIDGILLSRAETKRYAHNDMSSLERFLKGSQQYRRRVIVTDTVFSMDGDFANLPEIVSLAKRYNAMIMVDEAHAFGVFGKNGAGLVEHLGLEGTIDIQMGTFSKAAGAFGAYCCGSQVLIDMLINRARSFIYTTGLPPSIAAAALEAVKMISSNDAPRDELLAKAKDLRLRLQTLGFDTMNTQSPIIPVLVKDEALAVDFSQQLWELGIFVQAIRPPTVPVGLSRLRVTVMATHTDEDLEQLINAFKTVGKQLGIIA